MIPPRFAAAARKPRLRDSNQYSDRLLRPHRPLLALTLLALLLYLPCVWLRDVWSPDEPRYAEVAREMVSGREYFLPHLNGEVYAEKPPVFFWLGILAGALPGVPDDAGTRLVSALAALGTLLLTYRIFARLGDPRVAWLACLILATSSMFVVHATSGVIDGTLTFLTTAALAAGLAARRENAWALWALFYGIVGVALITKGPVGLAIPGGVLILLVLQEDGLAGLRARHPIWGLPLAGAVACLWLVPAILKGGPEYGRIILFKQNVGRAYESWHHAEPIHFFLGVFPVSFLPWVLFLPGGIWLAVRLVRGAGRQRAAGGEAARLALTWFFFTFIFFSIISGKKTRYLLPLFPAAAWLASLALNEMITTAQERAWGARLRGALPAAVSALAGVLIGLGMIAAGSGALGDPQTRIAHLSSDQAAALRWYGSLPGGLLLALPGALIVVLGVSALWGLRRHPVSAAARLVACVIAVIGALQWFALPAANHVKSAAPMARIVERAAGPDGPVVLYRRQLAGTFNIALRRDRLPLMKSAVVTAQHLASHPGTVVIAVASDMKRLEKELPTLARLGCGRIGAESICAAQSP